MSILSDFIIPQLSGLTLDTTGHDTFKYALDKNHFNNYPYNISYKYNVRGYRDDEWPENLSDCIWCVGDSFTSGVGQPYEHIWPQVLAKILKIRTINISMDGASNDWISRKIVRIADIIKPKLIIAQWSYINRRESKITADKLNDYNRRIWYVKEIQSSEDVENLIGNIKNGLRACNNQTTLLNSFIPGFMDDAYINHFEDEFEKLNALRVNYEVLDLARDGHHYDILTATNFVDNLMKSKYINIK
jgi:hypothetical protein